MTDKIKAFCDAWNEAGTAVFITGAGASTESGLTDFTGDGATFGGAPVRQLLSREFMLENPDLFNEYCRTRLYSPFAQPNSFHKALAMWEETGLVAAVITQNIDSLHQRAGSKNVIELHGNMETVYCDACKRSASTHLIYGQVQRINKCPHCSGTIRPAIVLYGEQLNKQVHAAALEYVDKVPLLIVAGTRMKVTAPIDLIERFRLHPGICVYMGATPPEAGDFDIVLQGRLGELTAEIKKYMV